jgi:hypothetical protein
MECTHAAFNITDKDHVENMQQRQEAPAAADTTSQLAGQP